MKLMTKAILKRIPPLYGQEDVKDKVVHVKFFTAWTNWAWFGCEYRPETGVFFGYVIGPFPEWGYFTLDELESVKGPFGLKIERDMYFEPRPVSKVKAIVDAGGWLYGDEVDE